MNPAPLSPLEAYLDKVGRAAIPFFTPQSFTLAAFLMFLIFFLVKCRRDKRLPPIDECLRVALGTVTFLTAIVSILGLVLPTPPAPPEMNAGVVRGLGLASAVTLFVYAGNILFEMFTRKKEPPD
jgi:hypothetical protein